MVSIVNQQIARGKPPGVRHARRPDSGLPEDCGRCHHSNQRAGRKPEPVPAATRWAGGNAFPRGDSTLIEPLLKLIGIGEDVRLAAGALAINRQTALFFPPLHGADRHPQARRDLLPRSKDAALGDWLECCQTAPPAQKEISPSFFITLWMAERDRSGA